jgi:hypothetical protein
MQRIEILRGLKSMRRRNGEKDGMFWFDYTCPIDET